MTHQHWSQTSHHDIFTPPDSCAPAVWFSVGTIALLVGYQRLKDRKERLVEVRLLPTLLADAKTRAVLLATLC